MKDLDSFREHLHKLLAWEDAHVGFDKAIADIPPAMRGRQPADLPYSPWQLLEHMRLAQHDILDFCRNPQYREMEWPADYWPHAAEPPSAAAWDESVRTFRKERAEFQALATDSAIDLGARIPHGSGQTYLREILLTADHTAYHVGQLIVVRRLLGLWPSG